MGGPAILREHRLQERRRSIRERIVRFVRALFSSGRHGGWTDDPRDAPSGGIGVREPRRPIRPMSSGTVALEAPPEETRDVWAVGDAAD